MPKRQPQPTEPYDTRPWGTEVRTAHLTDNGMVPGIVLVKDKDGRTIASVHDVRGYDTLAIATMFARTPDLVDYVAVRADAGDVEAKRLLGEADDAESKAEGQS